MTGSSPRHRANPRSGAFALDKVFVQLFHGAKATPIPAGPDFWEKIQERTELHEGRLLLVSHQTRGNTHWEMHTAGDEILFVISGAMEVVLAEKSGERIVALRPGEAVIVPKGVWHMVAIRRAGDLLSITPGEGTDVRED